MRAVLVVPVVPSPRARAPTLPPPSKQRRIQVLSGLPAASARRFPTLSAAKAWRAAATVAVRNRTMRPATGTTLRQAAEAMIAGAKAGTVKSKKGKPFKPSTIRSYQASLELHVLPDYGWARLSAISRFDLQELVDRLDGLDGATIRNAVTPLQVIYRRALARVGDLRVMDDKESANSDEQGGSVSPLETYARWRDSKDAGDNSPESSDKFSESLHLAPDPSGL